MNNAIIYCRLSSASQCTINNLHTSIENQLMHCRTYCQNNGMYIMEEVQEIKSARNMDFLKELKRIGETYSNLNLVI